MDARNAEEKRLKEQAYQKAYNAAHCEQRREYDRASYAAHREQRREWNRRWYADNRERALAYRRAYRATHQDEQRERHRASYAAHKGEQQAAQLKRLYGLTPAALQTMRLAQGNACAICRTPFSRTPNVDHDHTSGKVRGLLCQPCNIMLGGARDTGTILRLAAEYLDHYGTPGRAPGRP